MAFSFSADIILPVIGNPIRNGVISVDESGEVLFIGDLLEAQNFGIDNIQFLKGAIIPGLVNAHCHLELSHMLGKVNEHTGLVKFLTSVMSLRAAADEEVLFQAANADALMYRNGIVAVGDISNIPITQSIKRASKIYYHTFVEILGVDPQKAQKALENGIATATYFKGLPTSITPHAPYSVSENLFQALQVYSGDKCNVFSVHNQESEEENLLFQKMEGDFLDLYSFIGAKPPFSKAPNKRSIETYLPYLTNQTTVLVHNTSSDLYDMEYAIKTHHNIYVCVCPAANLYIENCLPDIEMFQKLKMNLVVGTDSLASNKTLNILEELLVLQNQKSVSLLESLKWATLNGAELLGQEKVLGSLEVGKRPGLNLISVDDNFKILNNKVQRLI